MTTYLTSSQARVVLQLLQQRTENNISKLKSINNKTATSKK